MQELDTPLRLTWSIGGSRSPLAPLHLESLALKVAEAGVLFPTLVDDPLDHPGIEAALASLASRGAQITLVTTNVDRLTRALPIHQLALDATGLREGGERRFDGALEAARGLGYEPFVWFVPFKSYLSDIPWLFRMCSAGGVGRIKLSNLPINASYGPIETAEIPRPEDVENCISFLQDATSALAENVALEIHDRFLWEALNSGTASLAEYGGCQAANSLAYLDMRGDVHPCDSWLRVLGNLADTSLEEIWASAARKAVRREIAETPDGCVGCRDLGECFAGCRGLSACFDFANQGRDPLCGGRR